MKHQINLITAQPYENGWRPHLTKKYVLGRKEDTAHPKYWSQNIVEWNDLADLYRILKPYIEGNLHQQSDAFHTGVMYGQFEQWGDTPYGFRKLKANVKDVPHNYFILDIETANPFPEVALNLKSVRQWLIETYPFITDKTGMLLHFSASAGVVKSNGSDDHHQIRIRAFMEHDSTIPLDESERRNTLRPFMKHNGQGLDFHRHIDNASHQLSRHFYMAPPLLTETDRMIDSDIVYLHEGDPINYEAMRNLDYFSQSDSVRRSQPLTPSDATFVKSVVSLNNQIKTKPTQYWWDLIGDGNRYEGHYNLLWSAYVNNSIKEWYQKLIKDSFKLGNRTPESVKSVIGGETNTRRKNIRWDIVVMDEIEQLLIFATDSGGIVRNPSLCDNILRELVEQAELVIGMDARLSNLSLQTLEHWRMDKPFDIYTQSKVKPFIDHHCTIVHSIATGVEAVVSAIESGHRVAVVSELDCSANKKEQRNLELLRRYVQDRTGKNGIAIDSNNASFGISRDILHNLGTSQHRGQLEQCLIDGTYQHIWLSPIVQSAWSYVSEEAPFDLVVGLYPNRVLTAPNIIQHIKRFRTSKNFVMYIEQDQGIKLRSDVYRKLNPPLAKDEIELSVEQFNARHELHKRYETIQKNYRLDHFIEIFEERGGKITIDNRDNVDGRKDLKKFVQEHQEEIINLLKEPKTFNRYLKLSGYEPREDLC